MVPCHWMDQCATFDGQEARGDSFHSMAGDDRVWLGIARVRPQIMHRQWCAYACRLGDILPSENAKAIL